MNDFDDLQTLRLDPLTAGDFFFLKVKKASEISQQLPDGLGDIFVC